MSDKKTETVKQIERIIGIIGNKSIESLHESALEELITLINSLGVNNEYSHHIISAQQVLANKKTIVVNVANVSNVNNGNQENKQVNETEENKTKKIKEIIETQKEVAEEMNKLMERKNIKFLDSKGEELNDQERAQIIANNNDIVSGKKLQNNSQQQDLIIVSNTDEDKSAIKPFIQKQKELYKKFQDLGFDTEVEESENGDNKFFAIALPKSYNGNKNPTTMNRKDIFRALEAVNFLREKKQKIERGEQDFSTESKIQDFSMQFFFTSICLNESKQNCTKWHEDMSLNFMNKRAFPSSIVDNQSLTPLQEIEKFL
jgi:hypothetical protein